MKKTAILLFVVFVACSVAAQVPFTTVDSINVNRINAGVLVHGDFSWNPITRKAFCEFPKGSGKHINFASALWIAGYDGGENLHIAAQTYRQDGNDYWPGPLNTADTLTYSTSQDWAKIWKVTQSDIAYYKSNVIHTTGNTPTGILTWPAKGNAYAQGNGGVALTISEDMAPFIDLNGNGRYEPLLGEYPDIKGDEALWWVFSDNGPTHSQTLGRPLGMEIHAMAYAYSRGTLIDNVVYYNFSIVNKSSNNYHNCRFGLWDDIDLGYYIDDFMGFDSTWRMGICYNGNNDDGSSGGHPLNSYGLNPPQSAVTIVELPGDAGTNYVPAGSFMFYSHDYPGMGSPPSDVECNYYLRSRFKNGTHLKFDSLGGYNNSIGTDCNYTLPGDPGIPTQFSQCTMNESFTDVRFVLATNDFIFNSGETKHFVLAQLVADSAGGCGATSFNKIRVVADTAWGRHHNESTGTNVIATSNNLHIYPNPAHNKLYIEGESGDATVTIYNCMGQAMPVPSARNANKTELTISSLPAAIYYVQYRGDELVTVKLVKE